MMSGQKRGWVAGFRESGWGIDFREWGWGWHGWSMLITAQIRIYRRPRITVQIDADTCRQPRSDRRTSGPEVEIIVGGEIIDAVEERVLVGEDTRGRNAIGGRFYLPQAIGEIHIKDIVPLP